MVSYGKESEIPVHFKVQGVTVIRQFRNEWKYCCSESSLTILEERLAAIMDRDENGGDDGRYEIHSLYFDDLQDMCARENDAGISERFKYRIRYYEDDISFLKLERKEKLNGRCHKESWSISLAEYEKLVNGDANELYWETENPVLKRFCIHCMARGFSPKSIVDYERCAFVEKISNVRITIDKNISVSDEIGEFLSGDYLRIPLLEKHRHVLEVKFDSILPGYIRHIITNREFIHTAFSKYYLGRQQLQRRY